MVGGVSRASAACAAVLAVCSFITRGCYCRTIANGKSGIVSGFAIVGCCFPPVNCLTRSLTNASSNEGVMRPVPKLARPSPMPLNQGLGECAVLGLAELDRILVAGRGCEHNDAVLSHR